MSEYVTQDAWLQHRGRADAVDDIADQFERRAPEASLPERRAEAELRVAARWPSAGRGWRSMGRLHPRAGRVTSG